MSVIPRAASSGGLARRLAARAHTAGTSRCDCTFDAVVSAASGRRIIRKDKKKKKKRRRHVARWQLIVWNASSGEALGNLAGRLPRFSTIAIAPGDEVAAFCSSGLVEFLSTRSGRVLHTLDARGEAEGGGACVMDIGRGGSLGFDAPEGEEGDLPQAVRAR